MATIPTMTKMMEITIAIIGRFLDKEFSHRRSAFLLELGCRGVRLRFRRIGNGVYRDAFAHLLNTFDDNPGSPG